MNTIFIIFLYRQPEFSHSKFNYLGVLNFFRGAQIYEKLGNLRSFEFWANNTPNKLSLILIVLSKYATKYWVFHNKKACVWCLTPFLDSLYISKQFQNVVVITLNHYAFKQNLKIASAIEHRYTNTYVISLHSWNYHDYMGLLLK